MTAQRKSPRAKAQKLDDETTELEDAARKASVDAKSLHQELDEDDSKPEKAEPKKAKPKDDEPAHEEAQRPEPGKIAATRVQTPTAPTSARAVQEQVSAPVHAPTHPPGPDER